MDKRTALQRKVALQLDLKFSGPVRVRIIGFYCIRLIASKKEGGGGGGREGVEGINFLYFCKNERYGQFRSVMS